ncbi:MAG TPA: hypothetical protein VL283_01320 [Candidatus Baltobacteraceae bacterium]|jgi:hypothetical protein|nr:hypothetical protein [Candidatus Baltobacteraceae bacterium]
MPDDPTITDELPQRHRAGAWVVLLMGIVGLGLGVVQWRGLFRTAFATTAERFKTPAQIEAERVEGMKSKDTDGDGLNDYEESYVYQTSPYLQDSDSDGADDKTELAAGEDPNCPKGKQCGAFAGGLEGSAGASATTTATLQKQEELIFQQLMNPTPDQIRQMLLQSGVDPKQIEGIDDATLLELYYQSLQEAQANIEP